MRKSRDRTPKNRMNHIAKHFAAGFKCPKKNLNESSRVAKPLVINGFQSEALQLAYHGIFGHVDGEDDFASGCQGDMGVK